MLCGRTHVPPKECGTNGNDGDGEVVLWINISRLLCVAVDNPQNGLKDGLRILLHYFVRDEPRPV